MGIYTNMIRESASKGGALKAAYTAIIDGNKHNFPKTAVIVPEKGTIAERVQALADVCDADTYAEKPKGVSVTFADVALVGIASGTSVGAKSFQMKGESVRDAILAHHKEDMDRERTAILAQQEAERKATETANASYAAEKLPEGSAEYARREQVLSQAAETVPSPVKTERKSRKS